jgi:hypothetical protein
LEPGVYDSRAARSLQRSLVELSHFTAVFYLNELSLKSYTCAKLEEGLGIPRLEKASISPGRARPRMPWLHRDTARPRGKLLYGHTWLETMDPVR